MSMLLGNTTYWGIL